MLHYLESRADFHQLYPTKSVYLLPAFASITPIPLEDSSLQVGL